MKKFLLVLLFTFLIIFDAFTYAHAIQNEIADKVIRLHIVANDDSYESQTLKLKVRDAILEYMKEKNYDSYDLAYTSISSSLTEIQKIAQETLELNKCTYPVEVALDTFYFPQKTYDTLSFPAGNYTALKINIGNAIGQNWWCVMYPSLCFSDKVCSAKSASVTLQEDLSEESFNIISQKCEFRFKIVDWFNKSL